MIARRTGAFPSGIAVDVERVGEYVVEIRHVINANRGIFARENDRRFAAENPAFMHLGVTEK